MKIIETKEVTKTLLALLTAGILSLVGCQEGSIDKETMVEGKKEMTPSSQSYEEPSSADVENNEPEKEEEPIIPEAPETEYSEWVAGEWTTESQEESDTCRLVNQQTKTEPVYSEWSAWSTDYVEASDTREVTTKVESGFVIDCYEELPLVDRNGYETGETGWFPKYKRDGNGYLLTENQTYYSYRDLISSNTYTLYQYETREVTNQEAIDAYYEEYPEVSEEKKLTFTQE